MALMIDIGQPEWMSETALAALLAPALPGVEILAGDDGAVHREITMLATISLRPGLAERLPNLELVQKLGAGVDGIVKDPGLPKSVRVARLRAASAATEIAEYALAYVLRDQRNMRAHAVDAAEGRWRPMAPRAAGETTVAVLGLGHIGGHTARLFAHLGFRTLGWSRRPKEVEGVDCRFGAGALTGVLAEADYVAAILPSTPETRGLFDAERFAAMKPGSVLINAGRGDLVVEAALLAALEAGRPGSAVLDVTVPEPLPNDHVFWRHPQITVTPHVSGWRVDDSLMDVAENYRRLAEGRALLHEVDRAAGY